MPSAVVWIAHLALIGWWAVVSSSAAVLVLDLLRRWNARSTLAGYWQWLPRRAVICLPPGKAALFLGVQLAATGLYLGSSFAHDTRIDFFRRQVLTSRNIAGGRVASFAMGGLNYQIEHHLFPNMPRPNLRKARPIIQRFCQDSSITYNQVTILRAWAIVAGCLDTVGLAARDPFQCSMVTALRPR